MLRPLLLLPTLVACSEYSLGGKLDRAGDDTASRFDTDRSDQDTTDTNGGETGGAPGGDDRCYDPGTAYDMHPAAGLVVTQDNLGFDIRFEGSSAGYTSELWLWQPQQVWVGTGHVTAEGTTTSVGSFAAGTELEFAIVVQDTGYTYYSGPSSRNTDGFNHAAVTYSGDCEWIVGFEDQLGGGDQDFNDIELTIMGPLELQPVP